MSRATRRAGWLVVFVAVATLIIAGSRPTPTSGVSEDRAYALAGQMKCLQCFGESVAGSQADIAIKMRSEIRAQMRKGRTDDEILGYFADRYGERVLLNPSGSGITSLVWILPVVAVGLGVVGLAFAFAGWRRQRDDAGGSTVSDEDQALVASALGDSGADVSDGTDG